MTIPTYPIGSPFSPITDPKVLKQKEKFLYPDISNVKLPTGLDFQENHHTYLMTEVFPAFMKYWDYPSTKNKSSGYYTQNGMYQDGDAHTTYCMIRSLKPKRITEVGSGFSTQLMSDVNKRYFNNEIEMKCVEPFPNERMNGLSNIKLIPKLAEDLDESFFSDLERDDILFIDSSHVLKTGNDVKFLYLNVLPNLQSGVKIHIHDIFLPFEYPKAWAIDQNRSYNEQYLLQALLTFSSGFKIVFSTNYAFFYMQDLWKKCFSGVESSGGSIWIEKI